MLKGMEGVMLNEVGGGKKEVVCAQLSCGDPQVGLLQIFLAIATQLKSFVSSDRSSYSDGGLLY